MPIVIGFVHLDGVIPIKFNFNVGSIPAAQLKGNTMFLNGQNLLQAAPIKDMFTDKQRFEGTSHGLAEAGYDIRIKQDICFFPNTPKGGPGILVTDGDNCILHQGRFCLASAIEEFQMPNNLVGGVKDKSTWARLGLSVFNTVIEPGFVGGLTLELVFHGNEEVTIKRGQGIAQVLFGSLTEDAEYTGKYQNQSTDPVKSKFE